MAVNIGFNLKAMIKLQSFYYMSGAIEYTVIELGKICACILAIYQISKGAPIGNFVMLVSYWGNFTGKTFAFLAVDVSRCLIIYRETRQFRQRSAPFDRESHRCRGTA